jgi:hypothetical protein
VPTLRRRPYARRWTAKRRFAGRLPRGGGAGSLPGTLGAANATSNAETAKGALAQAQSTAAGSSGEAQSTAKTSLAGMSVQSTAVAPTGGTATTNAIAEAGGSGLAFVNPGQTAYAFSTGLPELSTMLPCSDRDAAREIPFRHKAAKIPTYRLTIMY